MRLLASDGQRGAALAQYEICRRLLDEELGVDPSEETQKLYRAIQSSEFKSPAPTLISPSQVKPLRPAFLDADGPGGERDEGSFVCRQSQLDRLDEHLESAIAGRGGVVWINAEAGMGKTSLLFQFSRRALDNYPGLVVASGICTTYTGQGDPYLPFREILRMLACDLESKWTAGEISRDDAMKMWQRLPVVVEALVTKGRSLIDTFVPAGALLSRCLAHPEIQPQLTSQLESILRLKQDTGVNQERVFEEYTDVLTAIASTAPVLLILDDLHWADASSINLLFHLGRRLSRVPVLILGAYRPEEFYLDREDNENTLTSVLNEFKRLFGNCELLLGHESLVEDRQFVDALLDTEPNRLGDDFRAHLTRYTRGNPLFAVEMLREMQARGAVQQDETGHWVVRPTITWDAFPGRVEGVIEKRITRLEARLREVLVTASVEGEEFTAEVIARVRSIDKDLLVGMLSRELATGHHLVRARGVEQRGDQRISHYQFSHNLFQKYLYSTLDPVERIHQHRAVGEALECMHQGQIEEIAVHLARHFQEARLGLKASQYLLLASQQAARLLAFDEAGIHAQRGLFELEGLARSSETNRLEVELSLALAQARWHGGRVREALTAFQRAIELARALKDPQALARAVLAYEEPRWRLNLDTEHSLQFLREALAALGDEQSGLHVRLLVSLSRSLLASGEHEELLTTVDQALHIARQIEDPLALCDALRIKAHIDRRPDSTGARLEAIEEMIATAEAIGAQERLADALDLYVYDLLELGRIDQVDQVIDAQRRVAQEIKQPFQLHVAAVFQTMRAILQGEFETAERLANQAANISQQIGLAELDGILGMHMFTIRREQGRIHELAPLVKLVITNNPGPSAWRPGLALIYSILGQRQECRVIFEELAEDGFASVPQDSLWVGTLAYLAEICAFLGDAARAATIYQLMLPYDHRAVVVGGATACYGAAGRYLGMLARVMSEWEAAKQHFEGALALDAGMEAWAWLAHSQYEYAAMLLARGRETDRARANTLLTEAGCAAQKMGMVFLAQKIAGLQAS